MDRMGRPAATSSRPSTEGNGTRPARAALPTRPSSCTGGSCVQPAAITERSDRSPPVEPIEIERRRPVPGPAVGILPMQIKFESCRCRHGYRDLHFGLAGNTVVAASRNGSDDLDPHVDGETISNVGDRCHQIPSRRLGERSDDEHRSTIPRRSDRHQSRHEGKGRADPGYDVREELRAMGQKKRKMHHDAAS